MSAVKGVKIGGLTRKEKVSSIIEIVSCEQVVDFVLISLIDVDVFGLSSKGNKRFTDLNICDLIVCRINFVDTGHLSRIQQINLFDSLSCSDEIIENSFIEIESKRCRR